jgi:hypothetical protein
MAGFLYQLERALYWLSVSPRDAVIGVETEDDIVVGLRPGKAGKTIREQDKHSIRRSKPFEDTSVALWKTLYIWLKAINESEVDINSCRFYMVTNREIGKGITEKIGRAKTGKEADICIALLEKVARNPSQAIIKFTRYVFQSAHRGNLRKLIINIDVLDKTVASASTELREKIIDSLNIPPGYPANEIVEALHGWIKETVLELWRQEQQAFIEKMSFLRQFGRLLAIFRKAAVTEKAKHLVKKDISVEDRESQKDRMFVRQIALIFPKAESNRIMEAIDDYLCSSSERTRFAREGEITKTDLIAFDDRLVERWATIFSRNKRQHKKQHEIGIDVYEETLDHRESLAGRLTEEFYLTKGSYHMLSDKLTLGWHPFYKRRLLGSGK